MMKNHAVPCSLFHFFFSRLFHYFRQSARGWFTTRSTSMLLSDSRVSPPGRIMLSRSLAGSGSSYEITETGNFSVCDCCCFHVPSSHFTVEIIAWYDEEVGGKTFSFSAGGRRKKHHDNERERWEIISVVGEHRSIMHTLPQLLRVIYKTLCEWVRERWNYFNTSQVHMKRRRESLMMMMLLVEWMLLTGLEINVISANSLCSSRWMRRKNTMDVRWRWAQSRAGDTTEDSFSSQKSWVRAASARTLLYFTERRNNKRIFSALWKFLIFFSLQPEMCRMSDLLSSFSLAVWLARYIKHKKSAKQKKLKQQHEIVVERRLDALGIVVGLLYSLVVFVAVLFLL